MGNIRRFYYQNKDKIWKIIIFIVFIFAVLQVINYINKRKNEEEILNSIMQEEKKDENISNISTLTGESIPEEKIEEDTDIMKEFFNLCNNREFEKAYDLLTEECKETLFNTYDIFKTTYCDKIFNNQKNYKIENWIGDTYKVRIYEDPLATGKVSEDIAIQEYYTIVNNKLNINNYIGREEINKNVSQNNITINVLYKDVFKEYEEYKIEVINNTNNTIMLDDGQNSQMIYIEDKNNIKYEISTSETIYSNLKIRSGETRIYQMKFINTYISTKRIEQMIFEKVILNYDEYIKNINNYTDNIKIIIDL